MKYFRAYLASIFAISALNLSEAFLSQPFLRKQNPSVISNPIKAKKNKGFGKQSVSNGPKKPLPIEKAEPSEPDFAADATSEFVVSPGAEALSRLRRQKAEERNEELRQIRELKSIDKQLQTSPDSAVIPERVAQRMGKRMLPFVGVPLFGVTGAFITFWYLATYKNYEFQPALVAFSTIGILGIGLINPPTNSSSSSSELRNKNQPDQFDSSVMKITRQMSSGYYGEISHAVHTSSRKPYCIKKLSKQECMDPILIQREIAIHSRLSHENIVQFIGAYQTFDDVFLVMELCHGDLHDEMISVSGPGRADGYEPVMSLNEASWYVAQVLDAVSYLNRNHVYHRDIKPENLLLCSPPRRASSSSSIYGRAGGENSGAESQGYAKIKLCDFGWSVHAPPTTNHDKTNGTKGPCTWRNTFCGTAEYVPVEMVNYIPKSCRQPGTQHQSVWYDVRFVDCWAIGILAYELVIGVTPFYVDSKDQSGWMMMKGYYKKREVIFDRIREIGDHVEFLDKGPGRIGMDVDVDSDGSVGGSSLDADFCNFVESMTKRKPELRLTADQALLHDWIRSSRVNK